MITVVGVLELNSKYKYGMSSRNVPSYMFRPLDKTLGPCIVGCSRQKTTSNVLAVITVNHWETNKFTVGHLQDIFGECGDFEAEKKALLYHYSVRPWKKWKQELIYPNKSEHVFVEGYAFNVDPEGCRDIDDCVLIGHDGYMYIVIADVAYWVHDNLELFKIASTVGQTLYNDGKVVAPLLPFEEECSLLPGKLRRGLALKFKWDGKISDISFKKISFINFESFTYDTIYKSEHSALLKNISSYLAETLVEDSHEWIEQLMLFYNCEAAKVLVERNRGLLRSQAEPDIEKLEQYKVLGVDVQFLANKSAIYVPAQTKASHWGLHKEYYCHATSPIRRFADIVNQLALRGDKDVEFSIDLLNHRSSMSKKYERDMFFIAKVMENTRTVQGIVLNDHRVWVPAWKRLITCKNTAKAGSVGNVKYSLFMGESTWKRRMHFRFEDTSC